MMKTLSESQKWDVIVKRMSSNFSPGEKITLSGILFLIGVQELGKGAKKFKKDDKISLMHVALCCLLEPWGYYIFEGLDENHWPHYRLNEKIPLLNPGEQTILVKKGYY